MTTTAFIKQPFYLDLCFVAKSIAGDLFERFSIKRTQIDGDCLVVLPQKAISFLHTLFIGWT